MTLTADYWYRQGFARVETDLVTMARHLVGLYAMAPTSYLTAAARIRGFERAQLDDALYSDRSLLRLRAMRGSVYMVPTELAGLVKGATHRRLERAFDQTIGNVIGEKDQASLAGRIEKLLSDGPLVAADIRQRLEPLDPVVAKHIRYLLSKMATRGDLIRATVTGGWRSNRVAYALWEDWVGSPLVIVDEEVAHAELARRYFAAFGPASIDDFRWWLNTTKTAARRAVEAVGADVVETEFGPLLSTTGDVPDTDQARGVRLLPIWETALIGHVDRRRIVPAAWRSRVYDASGNATSAVVVDGVVRGVWQLDGEDQLVAKVAPLEGFDEATWRDVETEARLVADALGARLEEVRRCEVPDEMLVDAPRNRFMSPLKGLCDGPVRTS